MKEISIYSAKGESILRGKQIDGLYYFQVKTISPKDFLNRPIIQPELKAIHSPVTSNVPSNYFGLPLGSIIQTTANDFAQKLLETHQAFGHLHFSKIRFIFGLKKGDNPHCPACAVAGSRKAPLDKIPDRSTRINHRIHVDIGFTAGSNNPFQLYVDDFSRVSHLDLLLKKEDTLEYFTDLKTLLENQHSPWKIAFVRTDNEFVYTTNAWIQYCRDNGIEHEFSPPYRHDALGVVERAMQTVGICFRCMMLQGNAPSSMIVYALVHANVIRNHSPTKANGGLTPLENKLEFAFLSINVFLKECYSAWCTSTSMKNSALNMVTALSLVFISGSMPPITNSSPWNGFPEKSIIVEMALSCQPCSHSGPILTKSLPGCFQPIN